MPAPPWTCRAPPASSTDAASIILNGPGSSTGQLQCRHRISSSRSSFRCATSPPAGRCRCWAGATTPPAGSLGDAGLLQLGGGRVSPHSTLSDHRRRAAARLWQHRHGIANAGTVDAQAAY